MAILGGGERDLTIKLFANVDNFQKNMKGAQKDTEDFSGKVINTLGKVGIAVAAAGAAVASFAVKLGVDSVKAAMEAEKQQARLAAILENTGANEKQIKALNDQAAALGSVGVATRDSVTITQSQLATFDLKAKTIGQLTPAIIDYVIAEKGATASTDDFRSMTNGLAQALNGNFASLTASGFVLDAHTKELIKNGTESERAAALVDVLDSTYKGFNKTIAQTSEGQLIQLQNAFNDLKVEIGQALLPTLFELFEIFRSNVFPQIVKFTKYVIDELIPAIDTYLRPKVQSLIESFGGLADGVSDAQTAIIKTKDDVNLFAKITQEIAIASVTGFFTVINILNKALELLVRTIGFVVLAMRRDYVGAIEILTNRQNEANSAIANGYRELDFYRKQLDTTTSSTAAAYRELKFYTDLQNGKTTPAIKEAKKATDGLKTSTDETTISTNKATNANNALAASIRNVQSAQQSLLAKELGALRAGGAIPGALSEDEKRFYRSQLNLIKEYGGFIEGINLLPTDPFYGFGKGGLVGAAIRSYQGGSATSTGGININVVGTVIDPEGAARAIEQLIRDSEARGGNVFEDLFGINP